ncbi:MAG: flagellar hook-length control protein FliK [Exilibacterium sp.]
MVIDPPSLPDNASARPSALNSNPNRGAQSAPLGTLQSLIQALKLKPGDSLSAQIKQSTLLTPEQRSLLQQAAAQKPALTRELSTLLQSPRLRLLELDVGGHSLHTYTDRPLQVKQTVQIQLASQSRLLLLDTIKPEPDRISKAQKLIDANLRTILPRQAPLSNLLRAVDKILKLPTAARALLPEPLRQNLNNLQSFSYTPRQLSDPATLARAFARSGVQFEHRFTHIGAAATGKPWPANQDLKAGLLQTLARLQEVSAQPPSLSNAPVPASFQGAKDRQPLLLFLQQLVDLAAHGSGDQPVNKNVQPMNNSLRYQLIELLHLQILASLAKLQYQQIYALSRRLGQSQATEQSHQQSQQPAQQTLQQPQSWQLELPVQCGNDIHSLEIRINEDWVEEKTPRGETKKVRQWEVMLSFDIPACGAFHAQLKAIENSVCANFWAERETTLHQAEQKLQTLRDNLQASGVEVRDINCFKGQPPNRDTQLGYSLVDITT